MQIIDEKYTPSKKSSVNYKTYPFGKLHPGQCLVLITGKDPFGQLAAATNALSRYVKSKKIARSNFKVKSDLSSIRIYRIA